MQTPQRNLSVTRFGISLLVFLALLLTGCGSNSNNSIPTAPTIVSTTPANQATDVAAGTIITATFNKNIDPISVTSANFNVNGVSGTVGTKCSSIFLYPTASLASNTAYTVTINGITDSLGNGMAAPYVGSFTTGLSVPITAIAAGSQHSMAVKSDGTLWAWGNNSYGQLGDKTTTSRTTPTQIGIATNWSKVAASSPYTLALKSDGTIWTWGDTMTSIIGPVQIGTAANFSTIAMNTAAFYPSNAAIKADGTLWTWGGDNSVGQFGNGIATGGSSNATGTPAQIGAVTIWSAVSAGGAHRMALRTDGTLWAWALNTSGQLGDGTTINITIPTQVGVATNWISVSAGGAHTVALKSDGTLWAWGLNTNGQLGDGTIVNKSSPTQVGATANWSSVSAGTSHTVALKSDGTLWAWGLNTYGQLGDGTTVNKTTPTQVGVATNWSSIVAGDSHTLALKSDGTLWAWGLNTSGQLGDGTTTNRTTPIPVNFRSATVAIAPSGMNAIAGATQITATWSNVPEATSYDIYYSTSPSVSPTNGAKISCVTSPYTSTDVPLGTYYIIVVASNGYGDSLPSSAVSATTTGSTPVNGGTSIVGVWLYSVSTASGTNTTRFTFNADGTYSYYNYHSSISPGVPTTSGSCDASGSYATNGSTLTITTTTTSSMCGTIISPYVVTYSISGTTLTMSGDPQSYTKQ